jgi:7-cyano-7-deazaguanine synthase in queuosine biosynthesis
MTSAIFRCDIPASSPVEIKGEWNQQIDLRQFGNDPNLFLRLKDVELALLNSISSVARDLIHIAFYIYGGDQLVRRGGVADVYGRKWERNLHFVIPVSDPGLWSTITVKEKLQETLSFLTGDTFDFTFIEQQTDYQGQLGLGIEELDFQNQGADCVVLFSGGSDSLSAVVEQVAAFNKSPILVSHRSAPILDTRQSNLVDYLRRRFAQWKFPHVSIWASLKGQVSLEYTQRSRSFLYAALATAIAYHSNIDQIFLSDNGIVSINLPKNGHLKGTYASRTTHPKFLQKFQQLIREILKPTLCIENSLIFRTKADVLEILKTHGCADLLQETVSCAHTRKTTAFPHCGRCSQCIDRRFGSESANIEEHDIADRYEFDIFTDELQDSESRTQAEIYVRFAQRISELDDSAIFNEYPELFDCITLSDQNAEQTAREYVNLLRRHAAQVKNVLKKKLDQNFDRIFELSLPENSLLHLFSSGQLLKNQVEVLANNVEKILLNGLPKVFQSHRPDDEHEVQDAADALLNVDESREMFRELPLLPFASISTKPDHANINLDHDMYFVEMKFLKNRQRLNGVITEITSRSVIYNKQGAFAHFVIYDPDRYIVDDEQVKRDIAVERIRVSIIR